MNAPLIALNWPTAALVFGLFTLLLFRRQWEAFVARLQRVGPTGAEARDPQQLPAVSESAPALREFNRTYDNALLLEQEGRILADLLERGLSGSSERESALIRSLAGTQILAHFEAAYRWVYGSQLNLLVWLNSQQEGVEEPALQPFYENAKVAFPGLYEGYPFERYLNYLSSHDLIERRNGRVSITLVGREFLKFIVETRKVIPSIG